MIELGVSDVRTFLPARDLALSTDFYTALGWTLKWSDERLALLEIADHRLYLQRYYVKEWAESSMLHLTVKDSRRCFEQLEALVASGRFPGVRVAGPRQEPYGALVTYAWDPVGVLLHLAQWRNG